MSVIPIYACIKERNICNFSKTISIALLVCVFTYSVTASFGYLTFGDKVKSDILNSYEDHSADVLIAVILIALKMYTTYPILLFVGR